MTRLVSLGYLTFREAASKIEEAMFAGTSDRPPVVKARKFFGGDVGDGEANRAAVAALWNGVDNGVVRPVAIGGDPRRIVKLEPDVTREIPFLRRSGDFGF